MPLPSCPVLPVGHLSSAPLIGGQNRELMFHTNLVTDLSKLPQGGWSLVQLHPGFKADRVDHEVGMYVLSIAVGGYLYLMSRPSLGCEFQTDGVSLLIGDVHRGFLEVSRGARDERDAKIRGHFLASHAPLASLRGYSGHQPYAPHLLCGFQNTHPSQQGYPARHSFSASVPWELPSLRYDL